MTNRIPCKYFFVYMKLIRPDKEDLECFGRALLFLRLILPVDNDKLHIIIQKQGILFT